MKEIVDTKGSASQHGSDLLPLLSGWLFLRDNSYLWHRILKWKNMILKPVVLAID